MILPLVMVGGGWEGVTIATDMNILVEHQDWCLSGMSGISPPISHMKERDIKRNEAPSHVPTSYSYRDRYARVCMHVRVVCADSVKCYLCIRCARSCGVTQPGPD